MFCLSCLKRSSRRRVARIWTQTNVDPKFADGLESSMLNDPAPNLPPSSAAMRSRSLVPTSTRRSPATIPLRPPHAEAQSSPSAQTLRQQARQQTQRLGLQKQLAPLQPFTASPAVSSITEPADHEARQAHWKPVLQDLHLREAGVGHGGLLSAGPAKPKPSRTRPTPATPQMVSKSCCSPSSTLRQPW